jgi:hypothetical protein
MWWQVGGRIPDALPKRQSKGPACVAPETTRLEDELESSYLCVAVQI